MITEITMAVGTILLRKNQKKYFWNFLMNLRIQKDVITKEFMIHTSIGSLIKSFKLFY